MRSFLAVVLAFTVLAPEPGRAQTASAVTQALGDSTATGAVAEVKKKGGLFGKVKGLAKNKVVKTVAKVALCSAVPGGQMIAGALETKSVAGAATTAATGGSGGCMPGMPGMAGAPSAGAPGIGGAGVAALGAGVPGAGVPGVGVPGQPSTGMPAMTMTPEQMKQMKEQYGKMGMSAEQIHAMQQMMANMPGAPHGEAGPGEGSEAVSGTPGLTQAKGKIMVRQLPWLAGSELLQPGGEPMFGMAMQEVAAAVRATSKHYKIEARVEEQGGKTQNKLLSQKRGAAVLAALTARGVPAERLSVSDGGGDKDPRIVVSEGK
jgi:hypothetical protein